MILFIVIHHSQLLSFFHHGYLAVDVFFWIAGIFLMHSFLKRKARASQYTFRRIKRFFPPYLISFLLACLLDYKHLLSFKSLDDFFYLYTPFTAFLTLTEELGPLHHPYVIRIGGWFLSVLIIGGFLLYSLLEYNENLIIKVILPFISLLGFTYLFNTSPSIENFSASGAISFPLLRGFTEMGAGVLVYSIFLNNSSFFNDRPTLFNILSFIAFLLFVGIMVVKEPLDAYTIVLVPFLLIGLLIDGSWLNRAYTHSPTHILPTLGVYSLEIFLIHSPVLHIVHSTVTRLGIHIIPGLLLTVDLFAVISAAFILSKICNASRLAHHRA